MGVKGLWQLINVTGEAVPLESLDSKVLAIDVSLWLNQAIKGRQSGGDQVAAALETVFHRVCKLLYFNVKPVFVFDGCTPELKRATIERRRQARRTAEDKALEMRLRVLRHYMRVGAEKFLQTLRSGEGEGEGGLDESGSGEDGEPDAGHRGEPGDAEGGEPEDDAAASAEEPDEDGGDPIEAIDPEETGLSARVKDFLASCGSLGNVDPDSEEFKRLPDEAQYHVLLELTSSKSRILNDRLGGIDSTSAESFSGYQFAKLLRQGHLTQRLDQLRRRMTQARADRLLRWTADRGGGGGGGGRAAEWIAAGRGRLALSKIASESGGHALLISAGAKKPAEDWADLLTKPAKDVERKQPAEDGPEATSAASSVLLSASAAMTGEVGEFADDLEEILDESYKAEEPVTDEQLLAAGGQLVAATAGRLKPAEPDVEPEVPTDAKAKDQPDVQEVMEASSNADLEAEPNTRAKTKATVEAETEATAEAEVKAKANTDTGLETEGTTNSKEESKAETKAQAEDVGGIEVAAADPEASTISKSAANWPAEAAGEANKVLDVDNEEDSEDEFEAVPMLDSAVLFEQAAAKAAKSAGAKVVEDAPADASYGRASFLFGANANERALSRQQAAQQQEQQEGQTVEATREQLGRLLVDESRRLISLFGLPVVVSPEEAEAQCARLEQLGLTEGTITDDSDVWLFGASRVYRFVFSRTQQVRRFTLDAIQRRMGLDRRAMVDLALMCGSDYTDGVAGLGPVTAMEMLAEFGTADNLRRWLDESVSDGGRRKRRDSLTPAKVKALRLEFPQSFPSARVAKAYLQPAVDSAVGPGADGFAWGRPDLDLIRRFAADRMGWTREKCDGVMLPLMHRINSAKTQSLLDKFVIRSWRSQLEATSASAEISASAGPKTVGGGNSRRVGAAAGRLRRRQRGDEATAAAETPAERSPARKSSRRRKK
uniref:XPGN domain-containing protein n=1 Tax=Macrostomum lignano TaxID=282301 RepID=A0A1I8HHB9_9PLAT